MEFQFLLLIFGIMVVGVSADLFAGTQKTNDSSPGNSTEDNKSLTKINERITEQIKLILLSSKKGHFEDNEEYSTHINILEQAMALDENSIEVKIHSYDRFLVYNNARIRLENRIDKRIRTVSTILIDRPDDVSEYCRKFYKKQLEYLQDVLTGSNDLKNFTLETNSKECTRDDDDYDDY